MLQNNDANHRKRLEQDHVEKLRQKSEAERKRAMEEKLFDIELRRDKRESRHWIWNTVNTLIAAAALAVGIIALFN